MLFVTVLVIVLAAVSADVKKSTDQRISEHGYPVEIHQVQTSDGYILTMYRIPYSPKRNNSGEYRPLSFLQHGLMASSDCFVINGPKSALAFVMADAGYDVWLGNARGNEYSRKNVYLSPEDRRFWDFSFHEIAIYDMPVMMNYALSVAEQNTLHYIGHSQGVTVFYVLTSIDQSYNNIFKTVHLMGPAAYMEHTKSPLFKTLEPFLGSPTLLSSLIGSNEIAPTSELMATLEAYGCKETAVSQPVCKSLYFLTSGWDSKYLNETLLPEITSVTVAGASTKQLIHYTQLTKSGYFREFDNGYLENMEKYGQFSPPDYKLEKIVAPVRLYYGENDILVVHKDVEKTASRLPYVVESFQVPDWNHADFLFALNVKERLYTKIVGACNYYEETGKQGIVSAKESEETSINHKS